MSQEFKKRLFAVIFILVIIMPLVYALFKEFTAGKPKTEQVRQSVPGAEGANNN